MKQPPSFLRTGPARIAQTPDPVEPGLIQCLSVAQFAKGEPWRLTTMHDRQENLLLWITRGQGRIIVNGVRRGVGTHNAIFLPAGTLFSCDLSTQVFGQVVQSPAGLTGKMPRSPMHLRARDTQAQAELTAEIESMQREITNNRPLLQEALQAHLGLISVWLQRQFGSGFADTPRENAAERLVTRFARSVVRGYASDKLVADYAAELDVTPTHLTRVCRECCGKTAVDILTERRLYEARLLLARPQPAIKDVARHLGFQSAAYFTRFIQQHTGMTPTVLRRQTMSRSG